MLTSISRSRIHMIMTTGPGSLTTIPSTTPSHPCPLPSNSSTPTTLRTTIISSPVANDSSHPDLEATKRATPQRRSSLNLSKSYPPPPSMSKGRCLLPKLTDHRARGQTIPCHPLPCASQLSCPQQLGVEEVSFPSFRSTLSSRSHLRQETRRSLSRCTKT